MLVSIHALAFCTFSAGGIVSQHVRPIFFGNIEYYSIEQLTKMSRRTIGTQKMSIMYVQVLHLPFFALWLAFTYDFDGWRACNIHICTIKIRFSKVVPTSIRKKNYICIIDKHNQLYIYSSPGMKSFSPIRIWIIL